MKQLADQVDLVIPPVNPKPIADNQYIDVELPGYPYRIKQLRKGQTVTQDTQLLIDSILKRYQDHPMDVLEMGSGTGILSLLLQLSRPSWNITGIEVQKQLVDLSILNAEACNVSSHFFQGDIRAISLIPCLDSFDLIVSNPPFYQLGHYRISSNLEKAISKHEVLCSMDDILIAIKDKLRPDGKAFIAYPIERMMELKCKIKNIDLQVRDEFSLSSENTDNKVKTVVVELAYADY